MRVADLGAQQLAVVATFDDQAQVLALDVLAFHHGVVLAQDQLARLAVERGSVVAIEFTGLSA